MATNNSITSSIDICAGYEYYYQLGHRFAFAGNYIIGPICFVLSVFAHSISLLTYHRQAKKGETAYVYQLFLSGTKLMTAFQGAIYILIAHFWSGMYTTHADWFTQCYACMWYAAHCATPVPVALLNIGLMFAICMAADRVFAMSKPYSYRNIKHKAHQLLAFLCCAIVSIFTASFDVFRLRLVQDETGSYRIVYNLEYTTGIGEILFRTSTVIQTLLTIFLIILNTCTVYFYRAQVTKHDQMVLKNKIQAKMKATERTLTILCVSLSIFYCFDIGGALTAFALFYIAPTAYACGDVAAYCLYFNQWLCNFADFYILFVFSKGFRRMVLAAVQRQTGFASNNDVPIEAQINKF